MVRRSVSSIAIACALVAACTPTFSDDTSIVTGPRLLAVQAMPAEAAPGKPFAMAALYVGPAGESDASSIDWAICRLPKALGDPDPVAAACFVDASTGLMPIGNGGSASGSVPSDACELFGPDSPPPLPGQPSARPTDADATGGFYLPVRMKSGSDTWSSALERISCQPSGVTQSVFNAFANEYVPNENPEVASLARIDAAGGAQTIAANGQNVAPGLTVARGERASLRVSWPSCPATSTACGGAETFVLIDPETKQLERARESIVASWYATDGTFDRDRVGRDGADATASADNAWTAPAAAGVVRVWVVLRDARGGVGWGAYSIAVE